MEGESSPDLVWWTAFTNLDAHVMNIAILPIDETPARILAKTLYEEKFVVVARTRHVFTLNPTIERYCEMQHLMVSQTGDAIGFVDRIATD